MTPLYDFWCCLSLFSYALSRLVEARSYGYGILTFNLRHVAFVDSLILSNMAGYHDGTQRRARLFWGCPPGGDRDASAGSGHGHGLAGDPQTRAGAW